MSLALVDIDKGFTFKAIIFATAIMFLLPTMINIFVDKTDVSATSDLSEELIRGYKDFTGSGSVNVHEELWIMNGIYTPYGIGIDQYGNEFETSNYFYTPDHWISSGRATNYRPAQYVAQAPDHTVYYDSTNKCYRYSSESTIDGYKQGDLYTSVTMDVNHKSDVFFSPNTKTTIGDNFMYEYTGFRYSFVPSGDYFTVDSEGNNKQVIATSTSLNLVWYDVYGQASGISGQLVLSGSDSGIAYLDANTIVQAFNSTNNISKFTLTFNGVECYVYIKISAYFMALGFSIEDCFNLGYWSIMVTSKSTEISTYTSTEYSMNVMNIWDTMVDIFTFNLDSYNMSPMMKTIASMTINLCLYSMLITIGLSCWPVLLLAGAVALVQAFVVNGINFPDIDWWPFD